MHKQLLYVVKKTKTLNKEDHNNEVYTRTHHFKNLHIQQAISICDDRKLSVLAQACQKSY